MNAQSNENVSLIRLSLQNRGYIDLPASGFSMYPYIRSGKICKFLPCEISLLKKGDIVLYVSSTNQLIAHRYYQTLSQTGDVSFLCKGDTNLGYDPTISEGQIIGVLDSIRNNKGGRVWKTGDLVPTVWSFMVMKIPYASYLLNRYLIKWVNRWKTGVT